MSKKIIVNDQRVGAADFASSSRRWRETVEGVMKDEEGNLLIANSLLRFGEDVASEIEAARASGKQVKYDDLGMFDTGIDGVFIDGKGNLLIEDTSLYQQADVAELMKEALRNKRKILREAPKPKARKPGPKAAPAAANPAPAAAQAAPTASVAPIAGPGWDADLEALFDNAQPAAQASQEPDLPDQPPVPQPAAATAAPQKPSRFHKLRAAAAVIKGKKPIRWLLGWVVAVLLVQMYLFFVVHSDNQYRLGLVLTVLTVLMLARNMAHAMKAWFIPIAAAVVLSCIISASLVAWADALWTEINKNQMIAQISWVLGFTAVWLSLLFCKKMGAAMKKKWGKKKS